MCLRDSFSDCIGNLGQVHGKGKSLSAFPARRQRSEREVSAPSLELRSQGKGESVFFKDVACRSTFITERAFTYTG